MRTRRKKWAAPYLADHQEIAVNEEALPSLLENLPHPLYLEVGAGKGAFMAQMAPRLGGSYLCLERDETAAASLLRKVVEEDIKGVYLAPTDLDYLENYLPKDAFAGIFMNFPDPWPKKRHEKRRLCHQPRLKLLASLLKPGALLALKTDSDVFYEFAKEQLPLDCLEIVSDEPDYHFDPSGDAQSEYEIKKREAGFKIHRLLLRRI